MILQNDLILATTCSSWNACQHVAGITSRRKQRSCTIYFVPRDFLASAAKELLSHKGRLFPEHCRFSGRDPCLSDVRRINGTHCKGLIGLPIDITSRPGPLAMVRDRQGYCEGHFVRIGVSFAYPVEGWPKLRPNRWQ
jgi:hypothetical protein